MMMCKVKKWFLIVFALMGICSFSYMVQAENISDYSNGSIRIYDDATLENGKTTIRWNAIAPSSDSSATFSFDVELADNKQFIDADQYSTNATELTIEKSAFGEHGGRFYVRVRVVMHTTGESVNTIAGDWSTPTEMVFVKIDKTNFPGMYKVIKKGGTKINILTGDIEKIIYDENADGWIDSVEAKKVFSINTTDISKKVNGKYKLIKATSISSFDGVEYFPNLYSIQVMRYSGKKADLSKCSATFVEFRRHTSKQLTVIAPNAQRVRVIEPVKNNSSIDLRKCSGAVVIEIDAENNSGKGAKVVKLPKEKNNLKVLQLCRVYVKSLNLNTYTNLQQLYMYRCDTKSVKVNKCKKLRYVYICQCSKIKSLNLKSNKKLRGADFYETPGLTKKTVKKSKSGKYTWNKGAWWESTSAYKKDMNELY